MTLEGNPLAAFSYDNGGRVRERRQGNGLVNRYQYDSLGRLTEHLLREGFEDNPLTLWQQQYGYQSDGELTRVSGSNARDYQYDPIGQLVSAGDPQAKADEHHTYHVETFRYDDAGNRISGDGELNQAATGNRLAFFGDRHFEYDRFGNLIAERRGKEHKLLTTYEYDCRHRLIKHVSPNGRVSTYTYDAFNRRTSKTVDGKKTEFIWQGNKLIAECSDKDTVWRSYLYEPDSFRPLALVEGNARKQQKTRTYWYQNDHLGTPHSLTDSLGELVYSCTYNAYGQLQTETQHQQEARGIRIETNLRFQGQYWDEETGLHYNLNRYYDPGLGRYLTQDPIKLAGGLNGYCYVNGNPVGWSDPQGLFKQNSTGFEGVEKLQDDLVEVYRVQPVRPNSDIVLGGAFLRAREDGMSILQANNKRKKLLSKIESDDSSIAVNAMQHAQGGGASSPVISTTLNKAKAEKNFADAIAAGKDYELLTIQGPRNAGIDFNLELNVRGGRTKPTRFKDEGMEEFGIKDLYIPPMENGASKSGFKIVDRKK